MKHLRSLAVVSAISALAGVVCAQVEPGPQTKLAGTLGLVPVVGFAKTSGALPRLVTVTVCGLSLLV